MNRREWLAGAAAAGCALGTGRLFAHVPADRCTVVFDGRYSDAVSFANELARRGALALDTRSDAGWIARPAFFEDPGTRVIGLTPASDLALLRGCAAQPGLRVVHEALHDARNLAGCLTHQIDSTQARAAADALEQAGGHWPAALARLLAAQPAAGGVVTGIRLATSHSAATDHPGTLMSWMLLPRRPLARASA